MCTILLQLRLLGERERLQVPRDLVIVRSNEDKSFVLRPALEPENALHRAAIVRIAAEAVTGLGGIGDDAAAPEMGSDGAPGSIEP